MSKTKAFEAIFEGVKETYLGEDVPTIYQKRFGKIYNVKDIEPLAMRIARSRGIRIDTDKKNKELFKKWQEKKILMKKEENL